MFRAARTRQAVRLLPDERHLDDQPYTPGVVLIGDAAGWSDPIIGQGLSIAMRDVGIVTGILRTESDWSKAFADYGEERRERMRRLRIAAQVRINVAATFSPAGAARRRAYNTIWPTDLVLGGPHLTMLLGPDYAPAESFSQFTIERILALMSTNTGQRCPHRRQQVPTKKAAPERATGMKTVWPAWKAGALPWPAAVLARCAQAVDGRVVRRLKTCGVVPNVSSCSL